MKMTKVKANNILITNIQRFSLHDGPGIRTTVFLKGCSLGCPWCSNPENLLSKPQYYIKDGVIGTYGNYYDSEALIQECLKDKLFYEGKLNEPHFWTIEESSDIENLPGGVTFSGGEALLQMPVLVPVCEILHSQAIHIAVETSLFVPQGNLRIALNYIDFFYVDMKILNSERCKEIERGNLDLYLSNLKILFSWNDKNGRKKPVVIRIPVIGSYTDDENNRKDVHELLAGYKDKILMIELIKEHNLGEVKYESLGLKLDYHGVDDSLMERYKDELKDLDIPVKVCKM